MRQRRTANASGTLGPSRLLNVGSDQPKLSRDKEGQTRRCLLYLRGIRDQLEVRKLAAETSDEILETFGKVLVVEAFERGVDFRLEYESPYGSDSL
jgi:hypothetical protein